MWRYLLLEYAQRIGHTAQPSYRTSVALAVSGYWVEMSTQEPVYTVGIARRRGQLDRLLTGCYLVSN